VARVSIELCEESGEDATQEAPQGGVVHRIVRPQSTIRRYDPAVELPRWLTMRGSLRFLGLFDARDHGGDGVFDHAQRRFAPTTNPLSWMGDADGRWASFKASSVELDTQVHIASWAEGTLLMLHRAVNTNELPMLNDNYTGSDGSVYLRYSPPGVPKKYRFTKTSSHDPLVQDTISTTADFDQLYWRMVACDWGPAGMHLYVDGAVAGSDEGVTTGTAANPWGLIRINRGCYALWGSQGVAIAAIWREQFDPVVHKLISQSRRRLVA